MGEFMLIRFYPYLHAKAKAEKLKLFKPLIINYL
jgi:hypothetical protein